MSRIAQTFEALRTQGRRALIPYVTAGDPQPDVTVPLMHAMVEAGVDVIELGVPFSDPMADGPVIQQACERALEHHVSLARVLEMVATFRKTNTTTPVVLMGYLNPIEVMGYAAFAEAAARAGVDGVLTVDLPPEEGHDLVVAMKDRDIDPIFLLAPTSTPARIARICELASGFVYYVSLKGVTGSAALDVDAVARKVAEIKTVTALPVGVGFGIRDADSAAAVARVADAVVVGSALVRRIADNVNDETSIRREVCGLLAAMRRAMDGP
ncbi:MAG: tryptophan synthase subunit alpha [Chromatiales bacterium]|jgi:tryptophan synthase alpha chain|nr:tryptophan synthase subunit alpha [Chromatiales bacterium]MDX9766776.1 tryptophan synthase subunit alpha [Ectothiorhodospiraceae bacterium]